MPLTGGRGSQGRGGNRVPGPTVPVYVISVAAELTGLHPQTLRQYDRVGLVSPGRTGGGGRRYSLRDIELLREVAELTAAGIGLEGVRRILDLEHQVAALRGRNGELRSQVAELQAALEATMLSLKERRPNLPALRPPPRPLNRFEDTRFDDLR
jgi:MerR family transcriptional regulator, heat shock protein HspR